MIIGLNLAATRQHVLSFDPAKGQPDEATNATVFHYGTLDSRLMGKLKDMATKIGMDAVAMADESAKVDLVIEQNEMLFLACQFGLRGWGNFRDDTNNDIEFKTVRRSIVGRTYDVLDENVLRRLPQRGIIELGQTIIENNDLSDADAGK